MHNVREHKQVGDRQDWLQERLKDIIVPSTKPQHGQSQNINNVFPNDVLGSNSWKSWMSALLYETSEDPTVKLIFLAVLLPYVCVSFSLLIYFVYLFIEAFTYSFVLFYFHLIYFFFFYFYVPKFKLSFIQPICLHSLAMSNNRTKVKISGHHMEEELGFWKYFLKDQYVGLSRIGQWGCLVCSFCVTGTWLCNMDNSVEEEMLLVVIED